jgi:hypothetical protein
MQSSLVKATAASLSIFMFSGCAGTADGRLAQGQGTAIGALLGAGLGYAIGGEQGAAWGAGIGGAAGFAYGTQIAQKKAKYASTEQFMQAQIAEARDHNQAIVSYNRSLERRIAALESRAKAAKASGNKAAISSVRTEVAQLQKEANGKQSAFGKQTGFYEAVARDPEASRTSQAQSLGSLASQMRSNEKNIATSTRRLAQLDKQLAL